MMYSLRSDEITGPHHELSPKGAPDACHETVKKLNRKSCLKCYKCGDVLVCGNAGCPIVIHKGCMSCTPRLDDSGSFYCPYCLYKQSLNGCHKAKEQALLARKALASFLDANAVKSRRDIQFAKSLKILVPDAPIRSHLGEVGSGVNVDTMSTIKCQETLNIVESQLIVKSRNVDLSAQIQYDYCGDRRTVVLAPKNTAYPQEASNSVVESQSDPQGRKERRLVEQTGTSFQLTRKDNVIGLNEGVVASNASVFRDDCLLRRQMTVSSGEAEIGDDSTEGADKQLQVTSLQDCAFRRKKLNEEVRLSSQNLQEAAKTMELNHTRVAFKGNDSAFEEDNHLTTQMTSNSENPNKPAKNVDVHKRANAQKTEVDINTNASLAASKAYESVTHAQGGNLVTYTRENRDVDGLSEAPTPTEARELTEEATVEMNEYSRGQAYIVSKDENISGCQMENQNCVDDCRREDEEQKSGQVLQRDLSSMSEHVGLSCEEVNNGDKSTSSQESYFLGPEVQTNGRRQISTHSEITSKPKKSFGTSENALEEVASSKKRQRVDSGIIMESSSISLGRRAKLLWTVEEEEMLKEGVQNFSLKAKKNLPWKKILEFGCHVFDSTRHPSDLKDKWKNIMKKAHEKASIK